MFAFQGKTGRCVPRLNTGEDVVSVSRRTAIAHLVEIVAFDWLCRMSLMGHELPRNQTLGAAAIPLLTDTKADSPRGR
jgi:hypothetical protein